jgi:hypothetical protein
MRNQGKSYNSKHWADTYSKNALWRVLLLCISSSQAAESPALKHPRFERRIANHRQQLLLVFRFEQNILPALFRLCVCVVCVRGVCVRVCVRE